MYFRFDSEEQYNEAMKKYGKIPSKKENFDKLFPEANLGYSNRYMNETRLKEIEGITASMYVNLPLDTKD
jgi:flagellar biosynthesis chaperone FliJ